MNRSFYSAKINLPAAETIGLFVFSEGGGPHPECKPCLNIERVSHFAVLTHMSYSVPARNLYYLQ